MSPGVEPAVLVDGLGGRLGLLVVPLHDVRPARQDLAILGDPHLDAPQRATDGAQAPASRPVHADDGRRLRQPVALVDLDSRADEELREVARERRAAGHGKTESRAEGGADLLEHERVGDLRPACEASGQRLPALHPGDPLAADGDGPGEDLLLDRAARVRLRHDLRMDFLVDARHGSETVRVDLEKVRREPLDRLRVRDRRRLVRVRIVEHALEHVRERKERQGDGVGRERDHLAARDDVGDEVPVRQHGALGLAGRSGGVDDRRDVLGLDARRALLEDARAHLERRPAPVHDAVERGVPGLGRRIAVDQDHVVEASRTGP